MNALVLDVTMNVQTLHKDLYVNDSISFTCMGVGIYYPSRLGLSITNKDGTMLANMACIYYTALQDWMAGNVTLNPNQFDSFSLHGCDDIGHPENVTNLNVTIHGVVEPFLADCTAVCYGISEHNTSVPQLGNYSFLTPRGKANYFTKAISWSLCSMLDIYKKKSCTSRNRME